MTGIFFRGAWRLLGGAGHERNLRRIKDAAIPAAAPSGDEAASAPDGLDRFEACVRHFGLSEADLARLHRQHALSAYIMSGCGLFGLSFGATSAYLNFGWLAALLASLLGLLFLARAACGSLRAWQIRERRLGAFGEWLRRPGAWFPPYRI